jgi:NADH dehydrogenase FAD-containing subunit
MQTSRYLIVGGGLSADAACKGIRELDPDGAVVLVAEEQHPPYARPPLSKALWKGKLESTIWRGTEELGVDLRLGRRIATLDLDGKAATDDRGERYGYERLLLATGGRPRRLPFGGDEVIYFRTLDDYRRLRALADDGAGVVVIGGGFIGSEIAAALALNGCSVKMVFPERGIGSRIFPAHLSAALNDHYRERGVELLPCATVTGIDGGRISLGDDRTLEAGAVVAGIGIEPNVELAAVRMCTRRVTSHASRSRRSAARSASSMRTTPRVTADRWARTWPAPTSRTITCPSSTPIYSTSGTRRSASSTRGWRSWPRGTRWMARGRSITTSTISVAHEGSCSGTCSDSSTPHGS